MASMELHRVFPNFSFPGTFLFYFSNSLIFPRTKYDILFEIHRHQPFNRCLFFFGFVDNSFTSVLMLWILLFIFVIVICVFHYFHIFYRIVELLNGDLAAKIGRRIFFKDLMDRECNCSLPSKLNVKFVYEGKCWSKCSIYQVECSMCESIYIGNTQQTFKK